MGQYFGTDGFRGEAGKTLTGDHAYRIGRALGWYLREQNGKVPRVVLGKDTRRSGDMLETAVFAGLCASGADVYVAGVIPTPGVSYLVREEEFDCGVMISASHNPFSDNGIKLMSGDGAKIGDAVTAFLESDLNRRAPLPFAVGSQIGRIHPYECGKERYLTYMCALLSVSMAGKRIGLDCANGSASQIAERVFSSYGAAVFPIGDQPDGENINAGVGSTHPEKLAEWVQKMQLDMGFAYDGDADRCIAVGSSGRVLSGDLLLYAFASDYQQRHWLADRPVVTTVMTNRGLYRALDAIGVSHTEVTVGDRFIYEEMKRSGNVLGGEESGHIILGQYAPTGDGILTSLLLAELSLRKQKSLEELTAPVTLLPQVMRSVRVPNRQAVLENQSVSSLVPILQKRLGVDGRILLRASGTEPVIRILAEGEDETACRFCVNRIADTIREEGLADEG